MARVSGLKNYFIIDECATDPNYQMIKVNDSIVQMGKTAGSWNVLGARLFNISYANYLRLCRDKYGAELRGKNCLYVVPYFKKGSHIKDLCIELNKRMYFVEQKYPNLIKGGGGNA